MQTKSVSPHVLIFGAGAVGTTLGAWLNAAGQKVSVFARGATASAIAGDGLAVYLGDNPATLLKHAIPVVTDLGATEAPDMVILTVKNYSLGAVAQQIRDAFGDRPIIVALQNGMENQDILPPYFSKVVYGVIHYNSWLDGPGKAGAQRKGPIIFGITRPANQESLERVLATFKPAIECHAAPRFQDAVYSKLVLNLTNSLTTLIDFPATPVTDAAVFQQLLSTMTYEGVLSVKAAGFQEYKVKGQPTWGLIKAGAKLPRFLTRGAFNKSVGTMKISSMAQDIGRGGDDTELESLNGRILALAKKHDVPVPVNQTVYELCRKQFARKPFVPMDVRDVWKAVQLNKGNHP